MKRIISRRQFIKRTAASAAIIGFPTIIPIHVLGGPRHIAPSEKLNIAGIGVGGMGGSNVRASAGENIVALCDLDHKYAAGTFKTFPDAKLYKDYREMLDQQKDIDAVIIGTPDHTHAVISMAAIKAGKHVYCQKPLTHDIYEARTLANAAREAGVVTQMGIQGHSGEGRSLICEWIWDGAIGEIKEIDAWCSLMYSPPGHAGWSSPLQDRPKEGQPVPEGLNWDTWIGPAPMRPYHRCYHPAVWRCWWDFGCGMMGDRGAHTLDPVFSAMKLSHPTSVEGSGIVGGNNEVHPDQAVVRYKFPARDGLPPLDLNWYEGQTPPRPADFEEGREFPSEGGVFFKGTKGTIMCGVYGNSPRIIPETRMQEYKRPEKTLPRINCSHEQNWINACKGQGTAGANFDYSGPLTEVTLLGNLAKRFHGKKLEWDGKNMQITNLPEANEWVKRPRREGWAL